jgi:hypothetical protein
MGLARAHERGSIIIWATLALVTIGAFLAFAINLGRMHAVRGSLQNAVDSASLAGAAQLNMVDNASRLTAKAAAINLAGLNFTDQGYSVVIDDGTDSDVVFGHWYRAGYNFAGDCTVTAEDACFLAYNPPKGYVSTKSCPPAACSTVANTPENTNAVQVLAGREASRTQSPAIEVAFGGAFLGARKLDVRARATAAGGGPCETDCPFPLALADCNLDTIPCNTEDSTTPSVQQILLHSSVADNGGLTTFVVPQGVPYVEDAISCSTTCAPGCPTVSSDQMVTVNNGTPLNALANYGDLVSMYGKETTLPILHFTCPPNYVGDHPVVGFATIRLCFMTGNSSPSTWSAWPASCGPAPSGLPTDNGRKNSMYIARICPTKKNLGPGGCDYFGTVSSHPRLVE